MASDVGPYRALLGSRLQSQTAYRTSFGMDVLGSLATGVVEFGEIYVIFSNVDALGGLDFAAVALIYALAITSFSLADMIVGHLDSLPTLLRMGTLDAYLLRPLPVLTQLVTSDIALRRLGRTAVGVTIMAVALGASEVAWSPTAVLILGMAIVAGTAIYSAVFVCAAAVQFWLVEGGEVTNSFVYGGNYAATFPASIYTTPLRIFLTFVLPSAFVSYLPVLVLLDLPGPPGFPQWLGWCSPLAAAGIWAVAATGWRLGLRHYTGAGS